MREKSYQGLKDATSFGLLSDKIAVYFNMEKSIGIGFSIADTEPSCLLVCK